MAKTITLANVTLQSIVINSLKDDDGAPAGFACMVSYAVTDKNGKTAYHEQSRKYSTDTVYPDVEKLSVESEQIIIDLRAELMERMIEREGIS
jgi:hypothetical protein